MDSELSSLRLVPKEQRPFGRYRLLYRIGTGGMANLYLGHYAGPDGFEKYVAIKRIHEHLAENIEFCRMFVDEARIAARISHPNVVQVLELGAVDGSYFIAMEYVEGENLNALLRRSEIPVEIGAKIISQAADGFHAAHELHAVDGTFLNVVHRDVSPANLLIGYNGAVKVVDFGVAKAKGNTSTTGAGTVKGKFSYIAPEQLRAKMSGQIDRRADIFALGIVLYELTTRHRLFRADSDAAVTDLVLRQPIIPPSQVVFDYPPELEEIVMKALKRKRRERFQTAQEMHLALESFLRARGTHILPSTIANLMSELFADQVEEKSRMMRSCQEILNQEPPPVHDSTYDTSSGLKGLNGELLPSQRLLANKRLLIAGLGPLVALVILLLFFVLSSRQSDENKKALAENKSLQPVEVRIMIKASPDEAKILFDGKMVKNPFSHKGAALKRKAKVLVTARGYHERALEVPLDEGSTLYIALDRLVADAGMRRQPDTGQLSSTPVKEPAEKKRRKRRPTRKKLFDNPYAQ